MFHYKCLLTNSLRGNILEMEPCKIRAKQGTPSGEQHWTLVDRHRHGCYAAGLYATLDSITDNKYFCQKIYTFCLTSSVQAVLPVMQAFHTSYTFMHNRIKVLLAHLVSFWQVRLGAAHKRHKATPLNVVLIKQPNKRLWTSKVSHIFGFIFSMR